MESAKAARAAAVDRRREPMPRRNRSVARAALAEGLVMVTPTVPASSLEASPAQYSVFGEHDQAG